MSRPLRIVYSGAWYHVMNRGRRGEQVFSNSKDYQAFVELLQEAVDLWDVRISAYCLMPNHYHLLIQTPQGNLSRCMRHINGIYTQRYNRSHGCDGQLFRGRFKSILVEEDSYLLELVRYIHRNPLRAALVEKTHQYAWSSHKGYVSSVKKWNWLHKEFILAMFSSDRRKSLQAYRRFIVDEDSKEISEIFEKKKWPAILGSENFINWAKATFFDKKSHHQVPDSVQLAPELQEIKEAVCKFYGVENKELLQAKRGVSNEPRNMAIYLSRLLRRDSLLLISEAFNMTGYSSASSAIERLKKRLSKDRELQKRMKEIKRCITKSQTET